MNRRDLNPKYLDIADDFPGRKFPVSVRRGPETIAQEIDSPFTHEISFLSFWIAPAQWLVKDILRKVEERGFFKSVCLETGEKLEIVKTGPFNVMPHAQDL